VENIISCLFSFQVASADSNSSNNYQDEQSEEWIGEWMEKRGNRDQMV
jgi:hypothetical protein